ncbi:MAG TPA: NAD-dependent deacylase [Bacteroidales bacterium]|nr:NAD-dependent deacylase [Bacteroidales bacterium]HPO65217.1 NAD-dependent deacylase [Bacteroidales bacterium]
MKHLVALTGAGISAESGLKTFRDNDGMWENYNVMEVASYEGWLRNKQLVLDFYNQRRRQLKDAQPNAAHLGLAELEKYFKVSIITQNVDDLHERAGSTHILHLHGELTKARSTKDPSYVIDIGYRDIKVGDLCPKGGQLRPNIVWFGESVPAFEQAVQIASTADIFVVIGTSMVVYPAAGLIDYVPAAADIYVIDPKPLPIRNYKHLVFIQEVASKGMEILKAKLMERYQITIP